METSQKRAVRTYRTRLTSHGLARFEVLGRDGDRALVRAVARRLAQDGPGAEEFRARVADGVAEAPPRRGGVLAALRRSPLVGAGLDLKRQRAAARKIRI